MAWREKRTQQANKDVNHELAIERKDGEKGERAHATTETTSQPSHRHVLSLTEIFLDILFDFRVRAGRLTRSNDNPTTRENEKKRPWNCSRLQGITLRSGHRPGN